MWFTLGGDTSLVVGVITVRVVTWYSDMVSSFGDRGGDSGSIR